MKNYDKPFWSFVLACTIILTPTLSLSDEISSTMDEEIYQLITQIRDIEWLKRNIQDCYFTEKLILDVSRSSGLFPNYSTSLDGELVNRVFGHLTGTPEHERFVKMYNSLAQTSNRRDFNMAELFAEYMQFLQSGQTRLIAQLKLYLKRTPHVDSEKRYPQKVMTKTFPLTQRTTVGVPRGLRTSN